MDQYTEFETLPFELSSELDEFEGFNEFEYEGYGGYGESEEGEAPVHPRLGRGRMVDLGELGEEYEEGEAPVHPRLGRGRVVDLGELEAEEEEYEEELIGIHPRSQVTQTTRLPFRWMCHLDLIFRDPDQPRKGLAYAGSGTLISPNHVLTAGHCLFDDIKGSKGTVKKEPVFRVVARPGADGSRAPFGKAVSRKSDVHPTWRATLNPRFDFGVVAFGEKIGAKNFPALSGKPLGYWGDRVNGKGTSILARQNSFWQGKKLNVAGYPGDKPDKTLWISYGSVTHARPSAGAELIYYDMDTCAGQSGGPVWYKLGDSRYLMAIHTGSCLLGPDCKPIPGTPCFPDRQRRSSNRAVLISSSVLSRVQNWIKTL